MKILAEKSEEKWFEVITCENCKSILEITPKDIRFHDHAFCANCSWRYIECPICKEQSMLNHSIETSLFKFMVDNNLKREDLQNY